MLKMIKKKTGSRKTTKRAIILRLVGSGGVGGEGEGASANNQRVQVSSNIRGLIDAYTRARCTCWRRACRVLRLLMKRISEVCSRR